METIEYLLSGIIKLAFVLLLVVGILWLVGLLYPNFKPTNIFNGDVFKRDWLPAPKNYVGAFASSSQRGGAYGKEYVHGKEYNGYTNTTYRQNSNGVFTGNTTTYSEKSLYVRNLSIYEGGPISYGTTFIGEARETMFRDGVFTVSVIDKNGRILSTTQGRKLQTWAPSGWARFQATIPTNLPSNTDCALVFYSATQQVKVGILVRCN